MADLYAKLKRFHQNTTQAAPTPVAPANETSQLASIPGVVRGRELINAAERRETRKQKFLDRIGVTTRTNPAGSHGLLVTTTPIESLAHSPDSITGSAMAFLASDERFREVAATDLLFLDTETTGLAGGSGTVPFLIGIGWFEHDAFVVHQYLMRDYDDEAAILHEIGQQYEKHPCLVTYNGKTFDVPLVETRFLLQRIRSGLRQAPQIDLLHCARRLWKDLVPNCALTTIEEHILGETRSGDIPSEFIPYVYFDFIRGIRMERMKPVLTHNHQDIVSLASLLARMTEIVANPREECTHALELVGMSRWPSARKDWDNASQTLNWALERSDMPDETTPQVQKRLSLMLKRQQRWPEAISLWQQLVQGEDPLFALLELAKAHEHRTREYTLALAYTEEALHHLEHEGDSYLAASLQHRRDRLRRKMLATNKTEATGTTP